MPISINIPHGANAPITDNEIVESMLRDDDSDSDSDSDSDIGDEEVMEGKACMCFA